MKTRFREPTGKDLAIAIKFSNKIEGPGKDLAEKIEEEGFRIIPQKNREYLVILTPSEEVLEWDGDFKSLDSLKPKIAEGEYTNALRYLGALSETYFGGSENDRN